MNEFRLKLYSVREKHDDLIAHTYTRNNFRAFDKLMEKDKVIDLFTILHEIQCFACDKKINEKNRAQAKKYVQAYMSNSCFGNFSKGAFACIFFLIGSFCCIAFLIACILLVVALTLGDSRDLSFVKKQLVFWGFWSSLICFYFFIPGRRFKGVFDRIFLTLQFCWAKP